MHLLRRSTQCSRPQPHSVRNRRSSLLLRRRGNAAASDGEQSSSSPEQPSPSSSSSSSSSGSGDFGFKAFVSEAEWRKIDEKVNKYPVQRTFSAIGTGGDDFRRSMLTAVESVLGTVHQECISDQPSSGGKYVAVRIGPVWVQNADQVIEVFKTMRDDSRIKWFM